MKKNFMITKMLALMVLMGMSNFSNSWATETEVNTYSGLTTAISDASTGDVIKLTADIDATSTIEISGKTLTLDLNGCVLKGSGSVITVTDDDTNAGGLTIKDSNSGKEHYYTVDTNGLWKWDDSSTTGATDFSGLTAYPSSGTIVKLCGGAITGGSTNNGGGIFVNSDTDKFLYSSLTIEGGNIVGNTASNFGGGIMNTTSSALTISGGNIVGNVSSNIGGGIYNNSTFTMTGGKINFNKTNTFGGGINQANGSFSATGGEIAYNSSSSNGVGLYLAPSETTITLGGTVKIHDNTNVNLALTQGRYVTLSSSGSGMKVGVTKYDTGGNIVSGRITVNTGVSSTDKQYFTSDQSKYKVHYNTSGYLELSETVVLSETSTDLTQITSNAGSKPFVQVGRTLYKDRYYNTLCLPFSLTAEQITASPLSGCELAKYKSSKVTTSGSVKNLELTVETATTIEAGVPYLIKWASDDNLVSPVFEDVTIVETAASTIDGGAAKCCGTLKTEEFTKDDKTKLFLGGSNKFYYNNAEGKSLRAFRAYFTVNSTDKASVDAFNNMLPVTLIVVNGATGVEEVVTDVRLDVPAKRLENGAVVIEKNGVKYNLNGQRVE